MADTAVAGGLMAHQKDEHDIWTCKDCGWKYPNAKPSPKIRKHHKKQCPGKGGAHVPGGSSDEASDDDHHHSRLKGSVAPPAVDARVPPVETKSRVIDFASLKEDLKSEAVPAAAPIVNGAAKEAEAPVLKEATTHASAPVSPGRLMPHQKDEHDIWICKDCGWKYPNAKPSPKIRKNHKKHCPGKSGSAAAGGSSDEASDDEHHHAHHHTLAPVEPGREESGSTAASPAEAPTSISREIDFAALKESPSPEATPAADISPEAGNETKEFSPPAAEPAVLEKAAPQEALVPESVAPDAAAVGGLMPHQKDEHDIWICKQCRWKYPNAKPSPKIRKNHKKHCPGEGGPGAAGGSSDEASDHEHHLSSPAPAAPVEIPPAVEPGKEDPASAPEVPGSISREMDFTALKESSNPGVENETPAASTDGTTPAVPETLTEDAGAVSLKEAISKETDQEKEASKKPVSLQEAIAKETEQEKGSATSPGLMPHQKDVHDIWICKDCGWKYPNAKPSPKIRKHHKKQCPGNNGNEAPLDVATDDEASDDEHHSTKVAETGTDKGVKDSTPAATEAEVSDTRINSREFSFKDALQTSAAAPAAEEKATQMEDPAKVAETQQAPPTTVGGLMPHQKDEADIWVCKECGWRYPNAKPSAKIRKNHKKKCPKKSGAAKDGGSSDGTTSDDEIKLKGGKCFPCL